MQKNQYKTLKLSKILTIIQPPKLSCAGWWHGLKAERCDSDLEFLKIQVFSLKGLSPDLSSVNALCSVWLCLSCGGYILVVSKGVCNVNIGHSGGSVLLTPHPISKWCSFFFPTHVTTAVRSLFSITDSIILFVIFSSLSTKISLTWQTVVVH